MLTLTCPSCGAPFASAIQMDEETFAKIRVEDMLERCPNCHHAAHFEKEDYGFRTP